MTLPEQANKIRAEFEMYRYVQEPAIAEALVRKTEQRIAAADHPDPYICTPSPYVNTTDSTNWRHICARDESPGVQSRPIPLIPV